MTNTRLRFLLLALCAALLLSTVPAAAAEMSTPGLKAEHRFWDISPFEDAHAALAILDARGVGYDTYGDPIHRVTAKTDPPLAMFGQPVRLHVSFDYDHHDLWDVSIVSNTDWSNKAQRLSFGNRTLVLTEALAMYETMLASVAETYGPATGGYLETRPSDGDFTEWSYPLQDGRLDLSIVRQAIMANEAVYLCTHNNNISMRFQSYFLDDGTTRAIVSVAFSYFMDRERIVEEKTSPPADVEALYSFDRPAGPYPAKSTQSVHKATPSVKATPRATAAPAATPTANPIPETGWSYEVTPEGAVITGYDGPIGNTSYATSTLYFPSTLGGHPVVAVGEEAFAWRDDLTYVILPTGITRIGPSAFFGCQNLIAVHIPDSVRTIGYCAFASCASMTSAYIPEGVHTLEPEVFCGNEALTSVVLPESLKSIGDWCFTDCPNLVLTVPRGSYAERNAMGSAGGVRFVYSDAPDEPRGDESAYTTSPEEEAIVFVRTGWFNQYPDRQIGPTFAAYFSDIQWTAVQGRDGAIYVNVSGGLFVDYRPATMLMQFKVSMADRQFNVSYYEVNGVQQNDQSFQKLLKSVFEGGE